MGVRRDKLPVRMEKIFHKCWHCHKVGLKPGILNTKHGDYGIRKVYENEPELILNSAGLCDECAKHLHISDTD